MYTAALDYGLPVPLCLPTLHMSLSCACRPLIYNVRAYPIQGQGISPQKLLLLQTLRILLILRVAGVRRCARRGTRPALPAALSPVRLGRARGRHGRSCSGSAGGGAARLAATTAARGSPGGGGPDVAPADVGEDDVGGGVLRDDVGWVACGAVARPGAPAVEPVHVRARVVPDAEHQHHAAAQRLAHFRQAAVWRRRGAIRREDAVARGVRARQPVPVLDVVPRDLAQGSCGGPVVGDELGDCREGLRRVHGETRAVVPCVAVGVGVVAAAALVAAAVGAGVRGEGVGFRVGFEEVHLVAAVSLVVGVEGPVPPRLHRTLEASSENSVSISQ